MTRLPLHPPRLHPPRLHPPRLHLPQIRTEIREQAGNLTADDTAAAIARAALARGQAEIAAQGTLASGLAAGQNGPEPPGPTANERRLARLGAPGYVARVQQGIQQASQMQHPGQNLVVNRAETSDEQPGAAYDVDGDHDNTAFDAGMAHADDLHAHDAHDHVHDGSWDDSHSHGGAHMHLDGTSHEHDHAHDHGHHDHADATRAATSSPSRVANRAVDMQAGHSHGHVHTHAHSHYYRVSDGAPIDERLVSGEQLRTREYVSAVAFRTAGGSEGSGLSAAQYRIAAGVEMRLEVAALAGG